MSETTKLEVILSLKQDLSKKLKIAETSLGSFSKKSIEASKKFTKAFVGATAVVAGALSYFAKKSVDAYNIQARAEAELIQLHKENTGATDEQVQSLLDLASQQQSVGVIGDEAIIKGQAQLATFKLSTEAIASLTPAMADMVAQQKGVNATGEDFVNIGNLIGKVMEGQVGALGRYGVGFSDAQEEILKTGTATERAATLAEVLEQNYGGVNEALRETFEGQLKTANNTIGDFMEVVGEAISNYIEPIIKRFNEWADSMGGAEGMMENLKKKMEEFKTFILENKTAIIIVAGAIAGPLVLAFTAWAISAGIAAFNTLLALAPLILLGAGIALLYVAWNKNWGGMQEKTQAVVTALKGFYENWIKPLFFLINEGIKIVADWWKENWEDVKTVFMGIFKFILGFFQIFWSLFRGYFLTIMKVFSGDWAGAWETIKETFAGVFEGVKKIFSGFWDTVKGSFKLGINFLIDGLNKFIDGVNKIDMPDWVPGVGGKGINIKTIPKLATGTNYVPRDTLAQLHEGEAVVPKKYNPQAGGVGGGLTIIINGEQHYHNEQSLDNLIDKVKEAFSREQEKSNWNIA